jgi:hypothetical protein
MRDRTKKVIGVCVAAACLTLAVGIFLWTSSRSAPSAAAADRNVEAQAQADGKTMGTSWDPFTKPTPREDRDAK